MQNLLLQPPIDSITLPRLQQRDLQVDVLRTDLIDPQLSGNKFYKLKYNLLAAREQGVHTLLSFGGAWSNHLHALAAAGQRFGFKTIGIVRGEPPVTLNACLHDAQAWGMQLQFISREQYRRRAGLDFQNELASRYGPFYLIPEGGANSLGIKGCQEMLAQSIADTYSDVILACGTGTTMTGIVSSITTPVLGIQVLKGEGYLAAEVNKLLEHYKLSASAPWRVTDRFHTGGYARINQELKAFLADFAEINAVPLEPVYSGKVALAVQTLGLEGNFQAGSRLLIIHGGGLQGARGNLL